MPTPSEYALIAVDVQYDFLPGGALAVPDGDSILIPLRDYARNAKLVAASRDWHPDNHFSFSDNPMYVDGSWPAHCIQGTRGARIHPSVRKYADYVISKGMNRNPPDAYSAFVGKTLRPVEHLEEILQRTAIDTIVVGGLALDYCVFHTACHAASLRYRTIVPLNATRPVDDATGQEAIAKMRTAGVEVLDRYL